MLWLHLDHMREPQLEFVVELARHRRSGYVPLCQTQWCQQFLVRNRMPELQAEVEELG